MHRDLVLPAANQHQARFSPPPVLPVLLVPPVLPVLPVLEVLPAAQLQIPSSPVAAARPAALKAPSCLPLPPHLCGAAAASGRRRSPGPGERVGVQVIALDGRHSGVSIAERWGSPANDRTALDRRRADLAYRSSELTSWRPVGYLAPTFLGKMSLAVGADLLMEGISGADRRLQIAGGCCVGLGLVAAVVGATLLALDTFEVDARLAYRFIYLSVLGTLLMAGSLVFSESDLCQYSLSARLVAFMALLIAFSLLLYTLPQSFACSELVHGRVIRQKRGLVCLACLSLGLSVPALTLTRAAPRDHRPPLTLPLGVGHTLAVFGVVLITTAGALTYSDRVRESAELLSRQLGCPLPIINHGLELQPAQRCSSGEFTQGRDAPPHELPGSAHTA